MSLCCKTRAYQIMKPTNCRAQGQGLSLSTTLPLPSVDLFFCSLPYALFSIPTFPSFTFINQQSQCHVASPALAIWQQITPSTESAGNVQICHVTQLCWVTNTKNQSVFVFDWAHTWEHRNEGERSEKKDFGIGEYSPGWSWWRSSHPRGRGCRRLRPHSWRKWSSGWWSQMVWE